MIKPILTLMINLVVNIYNRKEDINLYFYDEENIGEVIKRKKNIKFFRIEIKSDLYIQTKTIINIQIYKKVYDINLKYFFFHDADAHFNLNLNNKILSINKENILGLIKEKRSNFNNIKLNLIKIRGKKINYENLDIQQNKITHKESQNEKEEVNKINIELEKLKEIFYCETNNNLLCDIFQLIKDKEDLKEHYKKENINYPKESNKFNYKLKFNEKGLFKIKIISTNLVTFLAFFS